MRLRVARGGGRVADCFWVGVAVGAPLPGRAVCGTQAADLTLLGFSILRLPAHKVLSKPLSSFVRLARSFPALRRVPATATARFHARLCIPQIERPQLTVASSSQAAAVATQLHSSAQRTEPPNRWTRAIPTRGRPTSPPRKRCRPRPWCVLVRHEHAGWIRLRDSLG